MPKHITFVCSTTAVPWCVQFYHYVQQQSFAVYVCPTTCHGCPMCRFPILCQFVYNTASVLWCVHFYHNIPQLSFAAYSCLMTCPFCCMFCCLISRLDIFELTGSEDRLKTEGICWHAAGHGVLCRLQREQVCDLWEVCSHWQNFELC